MHMPHGRDVRDMIRCLSMLFPHRVVFMLSAMAAATLTHTLDSLGVSYKAASLAWPTNEVTKTGALLAVAALGSFTTLAQAARVVSAAWQLACCGSLHA
jgi:hypothetical protein